MPVSLPSTMFRRLAVPFKNECRGIFRQMAYRHHGVTVAEAPGHPPDAARIYSRSKRNSFGPPGSTVASSVDSPATEKCRGIISTRAGGS